MVASFEVMVPAVVARHEAKYFVVGGQHNPIQLASLIAQNKVKELQADLSELSELMNQFDPLFSEIIDPGEQEAFELMLAGRCREHQFCSADSVPLESMAILDMSV